MTSALVGPIAFRRRWLEPCDGVIAVHEFDIPTGVSLPVAHTSDGDEETNRGGSGPFRSVWQRAADGKLRCVWV
jgi:hypothetical protein